MAKPRGLAIAFLLVVATAGVSTQPPAAREQIGSAQSRAGLRPAVMGPSGGVSAGHPLTTAAGFEILLKGGNAFDAGVATLLAGGVLEQDLYSLGGEALVLVYPKNEGKVTSVVGQGWAPKAVDVDWYLSRKKTLQGDGLDPAVVPGALHAALTVLEKWGTMSFEQVSARAIDYAENGFPIRQSTVAALRREQKFFQGWPGNQTLLVEARWLCVHGRRDDQADRRPRARCSGWWRRSATQRAAGVRPASRRPRPLLQRRYRPRDGRVPPRRTTRRGEYERLRRVLRARRGAGQDHLPRLHRLQARLRQPGAVAAADAEHPRELRPEGDEARLAPTTCTPSPRR